MTKLIEISNQISLYTSLTEVQDLEPGVRTLGVNRKLLSHRRLSASNSSSRISNSGHAAMCMWYGHRV